MAKRRRKNRTHVEADPNPHTQSPKCFVVKQGSLGSSLKTLVGDIRHVMEPNTASKLRERKSNKLRDFVNMAGPLGVSHMMVLSQPGHTEKQSEHEGGHVQLKMARIPRGPTLTFRVLRYALMKDVLNASKKPHSPGKEFAAEPLLILNNFSQQQQGQDAAAQPQQKHIQLVAQAFQGLFPSIKVHDMALTQARRIVLLSYDPTTHTIQFRHYLISVRALGVSRSLRKIVEGTSSGVLRKKKALPNLANASDISDYVLQRHNAEGGGADDASAFSDAGTTDAESEADTDLSADEAEGKESRKVVRLPSNYLGRNNPANSKRAIRLTELGPRMELGLVKIDSGLAMGGESAKESGDVLFHEFVKKSQKEVDEMKHKSKLKDQRRKEQEANVRRKAREQEEKNPKDPAAKRKEKENQRRKAELALAPRASDKEESSEEEDDGESDDDGEGEEEASANRKVAFADEMVDDDEDEDEEGSDLEPIAMEDADEGSDEEEVPSEDEEMPSRPAKKSKPSTGGNKKPAQPKGKPSRGGPPSSRGKAAARGGGSRGGRRGGRK